MRSHQELSILQQCFAVLMELGEAAPIDSEWSYYGRDYGSPNRVPYHLYSTEEKKKNWAKIHDDFYDKYRNSEKLLKEKIKTVKFSDIDWEKTQGPEYRTESVFVGTDNDSEQCELMVMKCVFTDGTEFILYKDLDKDAELTQLMQYWKAIVNAKDVVSVQSRIDNMVKKYV